MAGRCCFCASDLHVSLGSPTFLGGDTLIPRVRAVPFRAALRRPARVPVSRAFFAPSSPAPHSLTHSLSHSLTPLPAQPGPSVGLSV